MIREMFQDALEHGNWDAAPGYSIDQDCGLLCINLHFVIEGTKDISNL